MASRLEIEANRCLLASSVEIFTRKMFAFVNNLEYVVGEHHRKIFNKLTDVVEGRTRKLIINIAPRYGKTLLCSQMFIAYGMALNPKSRYIHLSYSSSLCQDNSMAVKDILNSEYFKLLFKARVSGKGAKAKWDTVQGGGVYAVSTLGQVTGFGAGRFDNEDKYMDKFTAEYNPARFAGAIVIDDPIKPEDALSDNIREQVNRRFETTIRNRVNSRNTPIVIIMQRLHEHDLCGYLQEVEPDEWEVLSIPCLTTDEDGNEKALWEYKHSVEELRAIEHANSYVFETQYQQNPKPLQGLMYSTFRTYETLPLLPVSKYTLKNYTDTADTGADYLCSICYIECEDAMYITDVLYTKKPMEYTEPETARMLQRNGTKTALIESNNGGRGFARNVEKQLRTLGNTITQVRTFSQTKVKATRIFTRSSEVQNLIFFPHDWESRWFDFARDVKSYRKEGTNAHDDAPDVLTGMVENFGNGRRMTDSEIEAMML